MIKPVNAIYDYLYEAEDMDESKKRLEQILDFTIRLYNLAPGDVDAQNKWIIGPMVALLSFPHVILLINQPTP